MWDFHPGQLRSSAETAIVTNDQFLMYFLGLGNFEFLRRGRFETCPYGFFTIFVLCLSYIRPDPF